MPVNFTAPSMVQINNNTPLPGTFEIRQDWIDVSSAIATKPDPAWELLDDAGHWHAYDDKGELPTLVKYFERAACAIPDHGDDCEGYDVSIMRCQICEQEIQPARVPDLDARNRQIPGRMHWEVTVPVRLERGVQVSVRVRVGNGLYFGTGIAVGDGSFSSREGWRCTVVGNGPLGHRKVPSHT